MADIVTNTLQIGNNNLILRDADAQEKISDLKEDLDYKQSENLLDLNGIITGYALRNGGYKYVAEDYNLLGPVNIGKASDITVYLPVAPTAGTSLSLRTSFCVDDTFDIGKTTKTESYSFYNTKENATTIHVPEGYHYFTVQLSDTNLDVMTRYAELGYEIPTIVEGSTISEFLPYGYKDYVRITNMEDDLTFTMDSAKQYYDFLIDDIMFCGDSITAGYRSPTYTNAKTAYPALLQRMLGMTTMQVNAVAGLTSEGWWTEFGATADFTQYKYLFIKLGQNGQLTDTVDTDCIGDDYTQYATTQTGYYGRIIQKALTDNPDIIIFVCSVRRTLVSTNRAIKAMAARFSNTYYVDLTAGGLDLDADKYHIARDGVTSYGVHFNDIGYIEMAHIILNQLSSIIISDQEAFN